MAWNRKRRLMGVGAAGILVAGLLLGPQSSGQGGQEGQRLEASSARFGGPLPFLPLKQFDRSLWTLGASFYPHPDIAVKADYQILRNESQAVGAPNQFNLGLGWWF